MPIKMKVIIPIIKTEGVRVLFKTKNFNLFIIEMV